MVDYFNRLLIFQDTFKRSCYEFSPVLLELGVNKLLGGLHDCFLQDKVEKGFSYRLTVKCYLIKHEKMTFNNGSLDMHYKIAFAVFNHLVENHHDDVLDHFKNNDPGDYCSLLKNTIFKEMIDSGCEERKAFPSPPQPIPNNDKKENSLHCTLNRAQLEELATFVNTIHLNYKEVTADDLETFFSCKEGFFIQPLVNRCKMTKAYLPKRDLNIILPIFRSTPAFEVGMPVSFANFCLACVIPNARFHEKERPGMPVLDLIVGMI